MELIGYLRHFSELEEGDNKAFKRQLPPVFWEDGGLQEAAVREGWFLDHSFQASLTRRSAISQDPRNSCLNLTHPPLPNLRSSAQVLTRRMTPFPTPRC